MATSEDFYHTVLSPTLQLYMFVSCFISYFIVCSNVITLIIKVLLNLTKFN